MLDRCEVWERLSEHHLGGSYARGAHLDFPECMQLQRLDKLGDADTLAHPIWRPDAIGGSAAATAGHYGALTVTEYGPTAINAASSKNHDASRTWMRYTWL